MKKWLFLFMAFLIFIVVSGCNSNLSSTALIETANQTTITTTIEDQTTTTQTTSGGTISETTLYLVEFDSGGAGVVPSQGIYGGELVVEPNITKADHTLDGWYLSNDGGVTFIKKWDFETDVVTENITLYAQWNLNLDTFEIHYYLLPEGYNPITDDLVMEAPKFTSVSTRSYFTVALTENHEVYTWGYNEYYQLGNGQTANKNVPTNITSFFNLDEQDFIIQVEAGYMHSLAITNNGKVYAWGDNEDGELGTGNTDVYEAPVDITSNFELLPDDAYIHSDQGSHYTSRKFQELVKESNLGQSMSRKGNCWDNAPQESFFGHMKDELHLDKCNSFEDLKKEIDDYIDYYNNDRYQWRLAKMTPVQYREFLISGEKQNNSKRKMTVLTDSHNKTKTI